jgi:hypothetical protein
VRGSMRGRNLTKPFSIAGFVLAEIYMLFVVLAPLKSSVPPAITYAIAAHYGVLAPLTGNMPIPTDYLVWRVFCVAVFFGPFGALVGMGLGLVVGALLPKR